MRLSKNFIYERDAIGFNARLSRMEGKPIWLNSATGDEFFLKEPTHPAGNGNWWIRKFVRPEPFTFRHDASWMVSFHEAFKAEAFPKKKISLGKR